LPSEVRARRLGLGRIRPREKLAGAHGDRRLRKDARGGVDNFPGRRRLSPRGAVSSANPGCRRTACRTSSPVNGGSIESPGRQTVSEFGQNRAIEPLVRPFVQNLPDSSNRIQLPEGVTPLDSAEDCLIRAGSCRHHHEKRPGRSTLRCPARRVNPRSEARSIKPRAWHADGADRSSRAPRR
jgi:hypothetical protein